MKRILSMSILIGSIILLSVSCTTPLIAAGQQEVPPMSDAPALRGEVLREPSTMIEKITAQVEIANDGGAMLVTDWNSKSKKSYQVIGDMEHVLLNFRDEIIDAEIVFIEKRQWSGTVVVVSIVIPEDRT